MTQVNLLPGDVKERQKSRRLTVAVILAVGAVVALLFFVFVLQAARFSNAQQKLQAQLAINADLQAKVGQLQEFAVLKQTVAAREDLTATALSGQVQWSGALRDISMVIPGQMWLTTMTATLNATTLPSSVPGAPPISPGAPSTGASPTPGASPTAGATAPPVVGPSLIGSISFQGTASDHPVVAQWLTRLAQVNGWVNPWISTSTKTVDDSTGSSTVQFSSTVDLTDAAAVQGSRR